MLKDCPPGNERCQDGKLAKNAHLNVHKYVEQLEVEDSWEQEFD